MTDYNPITDFSAKDDLTTGDANKIVSGVEVDAEFDSISSGVNSKANKVSAATAGNLASLASDGDIQDSGLAYGNVADLSGVVEFQKAFVTDSLQTHAGATGTYDIDWTDGNFVQATVTGGVIFTFTDPGSSTPAKLNLILTNGGAYSVTWPSEVKWPGGTEPSWTSSGSDVIEFLFDGTNYLAVATSLDNK